MTEKPMAIVTINQDNWNEILYSACEMLHILGYQWLAENVGEIPCCIYNELWKYEILQAAKNQQNIKLGMYQIPAPTFLMNPAPAKIWGGCSNLSNFSKTVLTIDYTQIKNNKPSFRSLIFTWLDIRHLTRNVLLSCCVKLVRPNEQTKLKW